MILTLLPGTFIVWSGEGLKTFDFLHSLANLCYLLVSSTYPRVREYLFQGNPFEAVFLKQPCDKIFGISSNELPDLVPEGHRVIYSLPSCLLVLVIVKRKHST